jgi:hypothetical protein
VQQFNVERRLDWANGIVCVGPERADWRQPGA